MQSYGSKSDLSTDCMVAGIMAQRFVMLLCRDFILGVQEEGKTAAGAESKQEQAGATILAPQAPEGASRKEAAGTLAAAVENGAQPMDES